MLLPCTNTPPPSPQLEAERVRPGCTVRRNRTIVSPQRLDENSVTDRSGKREVRRRLLQPEHRTVPPPAERGVIETRAEPRRDEPNKTLQHDRMPSERSAASLSCGYSLLAKQLAKQLAA